jgi:hypothetical protein
MWGAVLVILVMTGVFCAVIALAFVSGFSGALAHQVVLGRKE